MFQPVAGPSQAVVNLTSQDDITQKPGGKRRRIGSEEESCTQETSTTVNNALVDNNDALEKVRKVLKAKFKK